MINFNHFRVFYHAAKHLNFTVAAQRLYITQPAVTAQIKAFEAHCNLKLFKKRGRGVCLTDEGKTIFDYGRKIFEYEKALEGAIEDMRKLKRGILRLGTTKTYARYFMPFLITGYHEVYPHIRIHLDEGSSLDMIRSLVDFRNEIAVIAKAEDNPNVRFIPFSQEELVLIVAPGHRLTKKRIVSVKELAEEQIIMKELGSGTRKIINALFTDKGLVPDVLMETSNTEFIKELVKRGDGVSFVVREAVAKELQEKILATCRVEGKRILLDVSIAYLKDQHLSPPAKAFLDILETMTPEKKPDQSIRVIMANMLARWSESSQ
jgi:DNA-binding transcriptional LysR family regulator